MPQVIQSTLAERDLVAIWVYIAERNLPAADRLISKFRTQFDKLARMPGIGRQRPELEDGLLSAAVGNYVVFYRALPAKKGVEIARVIHGARDIVAMFRKPGE